MRTGEPLNTKLGQYFVQFTAGTAVGVRDKDMLKFGSTFFEFGSNGAWNFLRSPGGYAISRADTESRGATTRSGV
jgi:hypothetical protein